jgi:hypothetical protein
MLQHLAAAATPHRSAPYAIIAAPAEEIMAFVLDSTHEDYAAALSALAVQSNTSLAHDSTLKLVVTDPVETFAGALADLDLSEVPNALCHMQLVDSQEMSDFGYYLIGQPENAWNPTLVNGNVFVSQTGGGNGKTPFTPMNWNEVVSGGGLVANQQVVRMGCIFRNGAASTTLGNISIGDGEAGDQLVIRDDLTMAPGVGTDHWNHSSANDTWIQDGTEPEVWSQADWGQSSLRINDGPFIVFGGDFPVLGTSTEWHDDWILEEAASLAACRTTPASYFVDGTTLHVHMRDGTNPDVTGRKILRIEDGWKYSLAQAGQRKQIWVRFINYQDFGHNRLATRTMVSSSSSYNADKITFEGGRAIWSQGTWFQGGSCTRRAFQASTTGRILFNTSDRRSQPDSEGVLQLITPNETWATNAAADAWDDYDRHFEIGWVTVGPHPSSTVSTGKLEPGFMDEFVFNGYYFHHFEDTKGLVRDNADRHPVAIRGGLTGTISVQRGYNHRVPNGIYWYAPSSAEGKAPVLGAASSITPYTIEDIVFDTWPGNLPTAGIFGIQVGGDNDTILMDDGSGDRTGTIRRIVMVDYRPTGATLGSSPAQENEGSMNASGTDMTSLRSNWGFRMDRAGHIQAFSSVQTVDNGSVDTDATETVIEGTNTPLSMPLTTTFAVAIGRKQGTFRRAQIRLTQNGAGGATVQWQYWDGDSWTQIPATGFSDGTNGLTQSGTVTFTKPGDWAANTIGTRECFHIRAIVTAGSFSTSPTMDQCRGIQTGSELTVRRFRLLEPEEGLIWVRATTFDTGSHVIDMDDIAIRLKAGQDIETALICRFFSSGGQETLADFQARTKLSANTDADADSIFAPNVVILDSL